MDSKISHDDDNKNKSAVKFLKDGINYFSLNAVLIIFSLSCIFPLIWMIYSSLKEKRVFNADIIGLPKDPNFNNYIKVLTNEDFYIYESLFNSFRTTLISVFLIILFGFIVGYILARIKFPGNRILYVLFLTGILIPIHSLLVPIYVVFEAVNFSNKWFTLILPYVSFALPVSIFLVEGYIKVIPTSLEEAAALDGCSFSKTMFNIILPICKPILVTTAIINIFYCWNEFSFALVLIKNVQLQTVPLAVSQFTGQFNSDYPKIMSAVLMTSSPIIIFYFIFSKHIIKGMVSGAVKG